MNQSYWSTLKDIGTFIRKYLDEVSGREAKANLTYFKNKEKRQVDTCLHKSGWITILPSPYDQILPQ